MLITLQANTESFMLLSECSRIQHRQTTSHQADDKSVTGTD